MTENQEKKSLQEKLPSTHFENYLERNKALLGKNPLDLIEQATRQIPGYSITALDDRPYMAVGLIIFKEMLRKLSDASGDPLVRAMIEKITLHDVYEGTAEYKSEFRSHMNMLHHTHRFSKTRMVFRLEEALTAKLLYTDINKVDSSFVRSPFPSLFISTPHNREIMIPNAETGMHRMTGVYITYSEEDMLTQSANFPEAERDPDGIHPDLKFEGVPCTKVFRIMAIGEKNENSKNEYDDATFFMTLMFAPGDVFPQVEYLVEKYSDPKEYARSSGFMRKLFMFCVNTLLYITSPLASLEKIDAKYERSLSNNAKERDRVKKKNKGLSKIGVMSVGSDVYISHEYRQQYRNGTLRNLPSVLNQVGTPMWMVRGHYRNQACGVGRQQRSLIWIQPHVKGKGVLEETPPRDYHVS